MSLIKGRVERVSEFKGQYGSMFTLTVSGEKYDSGKSAQGVSEGDYVEFSATKNARGYWGIDKGTLARAEAPAGESKAKQPAPTAATYKDDRQDSIVYQNSRTCALGFVDILVTNGLIDFGKAKGADKIAIAEAYLDNFTEHMFTEVKQTKTFPSQDTKSDTALGLKEEASSDGPY